MRGSAAEEDRESASRRCRETPPRTGETQTVYNKSARRKSVIVRSPFREFFEIGTNTIKGILLT